jgi:hypothetical protein
MNDRQPLRSSNENRPDNRAHRENEENELDKAPGGISLFLVYGLMLLALLIAIGLATLIVLPFYRHR